jgi:molybdopterin/thiamine biosynthesis adenylyltransferase
MRNTMRHDDFFKKETWVDPLHIVGVGGVGSELSRLLFRLGVGTANRVDLYDGDTVQPHNLPNQVYGDAGTDDVSSYKVDALLRHAHRWGGTDILKNVHAHNHHVASPTAFSGFVFLCLDRMHARKNIWETSIRKNADVALMFESRMDATYCIVFCIDPNDETHIERWEKAWFPDNQAEHQIGCGGHIAIPSTVVITAGLMANVFVQAARIEQQDVDLRLPNKVVLDLSSYELYTEYW